MWNYGIEDIFEPITQAAFENYLNLCRGLAKSVKQCGN